jgi:gliding motility-associated-like protein
MMKHFTFRSLQGIFRNASIAIIILLTLFQTESYAQTKVFANDVTENSTGVGSHVENIGNAITTNDATFATLKSYGGAALGLGAYSGGIILKFPSNIPANKTTYVRIDFDPAALNGLLGGTLGGTLSSVVGSLVIGNHQFEIDARNSSGTSVLKGNSIAGFDNASNIRLVKDKNGFTLVAITPTQTYDRIYITDKTTSLLLSAINQTKVFYAYHLDGNDPCDNNVYANYDEQGISLDALNLSGGENFDFEKIIDADKTNFYNLSTGVLGVAASKSLNVYFPNLSNTTDNINLRFRTSAALLNLGLLNNLSVTAYNGITPVYTTSVSSLLGADLLGLLNNGQIVTLPFAPGVPFDGVRITLSNLVSANVTQYVEVYGVTRSPAFPTFTSPASNTVNTCYNTTANLTATTAAANELVWYDVADDGIALKAVAYNAGFTTPALLANKTYYVASRKAGCTSESVRVPVSVVVNPEIVFNGATLTNATAGSVYTKQIAAATGGTPTYTYALASGSTLPTGLAISSTGLITGTPTVPNTYTFSVVATDTKNCTTTATYNLTVTNALVLTPGSLPNGVTNTPYPTQVIPDATGGTGPYTYTATNLPPGLTFDPATKEIKGTPTQAGTYTIPVTVTDANGNTVTSNFTVKITDPLVLPAATLANGTTGTVYPTQIIPLATGGSTPYTYSATGLPPGLTFDPATREITGTPTQAGTFTVPVTITDGDGKTVTTNYSITVVDPLVLPAATLADGTEGVLYPTQTIPAATGGSGSYTYTASNLPPGLTFDPATREIKGTPTQAGNYVVTVNVNDGQGKTATNTYPIKVIGVLSLPSATLANGVVGTTYPTQTLPAVTGGTAPYTYLATGLPPELNFNTSTREITGTPTLGGTYTVSLTATDANGNKVNTDYTITVTVNPPTVATATVCSGSPATLSVNNLQAGVTYNWYGSTGSTPLATNNNGVFVTPPVTAQTVFYVEAVSGTAVSSRTAVTVSVNPPATLATVTTNNQVINAGQTTTLIATADAGNTIAWFDAATNGTQVGTGSSFTTPVLNATTTYYVQTTNSNGCVSASRVPVTVTVITSGGGTACNAANAQSTAITGICVLCSINGAGNSTDADATNFTRITLGVGVGATGYQQLIFPSVGAATDSIRLDLALPTGLLDLTALSNYTINVMNGSTVVRTVQLNSSLLNLQLLTGNRFAATVLAGGAYDRVEIRFGALVSAITSLDIYGANVIYPNPTLTAGNQTICSGSTATLSATANGGTTLAWYSAAVGGSLLANGETYTTPALNATTTYYIEVSKGTCANTTRVPVTVTVTPVLPTPVLATITASCAGSTSTLSVSNPDAGVTYKWYDAANAGNLLFTGTTFITPVLNANTTFYVEASQGNCTSATRAAAAVTVNPRPVLPVVTASATTVNPGQTAILTATSTESNITFNWYTSNTSTSPVYTGATYVTPPLLATTTYYVEAANANGCTSATRVQVTINVDGNGSPNPVPCESALTETNGVNGVALLSGVFNSALAVDNDTQTASSLVMPVGALGASVYQRANFGSSSQLGDTVKVLISSPGKLLSLSLLGNVELTTFNGGTSNNDARPLSNTTLLNLQLLSGDTQALITFVPTATFDAVELKLNAGLLGALTSINFNAAQRILVAPTVVAANVTGCVGQTTQLQVNNPVAGFTYQWYDATGTYIAGKDGVTFTTPTLTANTKFYVAAVSPSGCVSYKTVVNVTTNPAPVTPVLLAPSVNTCANTAVTFQVKDPIVGTDYNWYATANSTTILFTGDTFNTPTVTANTSYFVEAVNSCGSSSTRTEGQINIGSIDIPVVTPPVVTISEGSVAVLTATSSTAGATINWYSTETSTVPIFTGTTFSTPQLSATTTYYVEATVPGGCPATAKASVVVTVIPNGTPVATPCGAATTTVAQGVDGVVLLGGVYNPTLAVDNDVNTGSSLVIPVGLLGSSVYHHVGFTGLSNVGDTLRVKITTPGKLLSLALLQNLTVRTYNGTTPNNDLTSISNPFITLTLLSGDASAILTFVPTSKFDGVELRLNSGLLGALTSVNLDYAQRTIPVPTVTAATSSACQGSSATLSVQNPQATGVVYKWYLAGTYLGAATDGPTYTTDATLAAGTYEYSVTATANGCETKPAKVTLTILPPPSTPVAATGNPTTTCINTPATLSVQAVAGVTYNWYDAATNGNMLVSNNSSYTTSASLAPGTYDFYVEAVNGNNCSNATRTKISITVNPSSTAADVTITGNTSICASGTTTLTATSTTVNNPTFTWYSDAALTNPVHTGATYITPAINATTKYYVTVNGTNKCANPVGTAAEVTIILNPIAVAADISLAGTSTICNGSTVKLTATTTTVTNPVFTWYSDAALTTPVFTGPEFTTPALSANTTYYVSVRGDNKCENTAATAKSITITVNPFATDADITASGLTTICKNSGTVLSVTSATVTNPVFTWYSDANFGTVVHVGPTFNIPTLAATTTYYVSVRGDNKCENLSTAAKVITVTVNDYATAADVTVSNAQICAGNAAVLMASSLTVTQPVFTWYSDASLTSVAFVGPTFTVTGLTATTTYYVTVKGANKCENAAADAKAVTVTVNPLATTTDIIVTGDNIACAGSAVVLSATSPSVNNPIFTWYSDASLTNVSHIGATFTTPTLTTSTTYYVTVKGDNKCENAAGTAKVIAITVKPVSTASDITAADATICSGSTASITATTTTVTNPTFTWYSDAALTTVAYVGATFTTPGLTATTKYYVTVKGDNKCENTGITAKVVTVTVNEAATAADITLSTPAIVCGSGTVVINASSTTVTSPVFTWYSDASLTTVAAVGPSFTTPNLTATTTYYVTVKGSNKCENSALNAKAITITVNPIAIASDVSVTGSTSTCEGSAAVLTASTTTVTSPVFTWYSDAALTNVVFTGAVFTTPNLTANTTYYVTVKGSNRCESSAASAKAVAITVKPIATASDINATDVTICSGSTTVLAATTTTVTNPIFTWYSDAALTTVAYVGASFTTPSLTATTKYYVTVKGDNRCENTGTTAKVVTVTVNQGATAADITLSTPSTVCGSGTVVINASSTTVTSPVFTWYSDASLTTVVNVGAAFTTPNLTTTTTYYVTVKGSDKCESSAANAKAITITVNPIAVANDVTVTGSTSICAGTQAVLTASTTTVTSPVFTWYSDAALTNVVFTGAVFTAPGFTGTRTYYVTVKGSNKCENTAATAKSVTIVVNDLPLNPVVATAGTNICSGEATVLNLTNPQTGVTYEWYSAAVGGNLLYTGTSYTTAVLNASTDYYVVAIGAAGCNNNGGRVKVTVTVNPKPTVPTVTSASVSVCTGSAASLSVSNPQTGVTYNWYTSLASGTIVGTGSTFLTPAVNTNATYYVEATSGSCTSTARTPVNVIPLPVPVAPASATPANGILCAGSTTTITVNNPVAGLIYRWYAASSSGAVLAEGVSFTTPALNTTTTYYVESIAVGGCASPTRTPVTVTVLPVLDKPVVSVTATTPNSVTFGWPAVAGASGYEVSTDNGLTWILPTNGATGTTYFVTGLKPDQSVTIIVRAKGQLDCQTSANATPVTGKSSNPLGNEVFVPNAFTPNNDGKNDVFLIYGNTITSARMFIYTQWGQLIFQSDNVANGWDGTFKGVNQPIGVYVYMVEVQFNDGTSTMKKGTITLIR